MIVIPYKPNKYQADFHKDPSRFKIISGGRRVGKTLCCLQEAIRHCLSEPNRLCFWVAPNYKLAKEVGWDEFLNYFEVLKPAIKHMHSTQLKVTFYNGSQLFFKGSDNPDSLRGRGLTMVIMDEAAFCKTQAWSQILRPALSDKNGRAVLISTPNGFNWFKKAFDTESKQWTTYLWPTSLNPLISVQELLDVRAQISDNDYRQEYLAEFVTKAGRVYQEFDGSNIIERRSIDPNIHDIYLGIDFGYASFTAVVFIAVNRATEEVIQFDELYVSRTQMDDVVKLIESRLVSNGLSRRDLKYCYTDPAGNAEELMAGLSPVDFMRNLGYAVINKGSSILYGISLVRAFIKNSLGQVRFRITQNCTETIRCFNGYQYDISKDGVAREEALKDGIHDHLMDALRYFFVNRFDNSKWVAQTPDQRHYTNTMGPKIVKQCATCKRPFISQTPRDEPPHVCTSCREQQC